MNKRVLLVDDEAEFRAAVAAVLAPHFEVFQASSAPEALEQCEEHGPFAVVVSDHSMPGMTGIELFSALAEQWPDTARILVTGRAELALALEALERGAVFRFLSKPSAVPRLLEAVTAGAERHRVIEEERALTEQLAFARESLQALNGALEMRLENELDRLDALARESEHIAASVSADDVLERTAGAVRELLGSRATEVRVGSGEDGLEIVPQGELPAGERRSLAILSCTARGALAGTERRSRERDTQRAALLALEAMARHRDDESGDHLVRVSLYTRFLAVALRDAGAHVDDLTDDFIENIALAAPLHDVGKVAIPDAILFKPDKLDQREWEIMRTHAAAGAEILRVVHASTKLPASALLEMAREIAWTHHERWDGTGYPRGLAREEIPLSGRIMSLCDCYDALTSERPYKHAWPHDAALTYIAEQRGLAFDPTIVDVFLARGNELEGLLSGARAAGSWK